MAAQPRLVNKQFNSPIGLYSEQNVREVIQRESQILGNGAVGVNFYNPGAGKPANLQNSAVLRMLEEEENRQRNGHHPSNDYAPKSLRENIVWPPPEYEVRNQIRGVFKDTVTPGVKRVAWPPPQESGEYSEQAPVQSQGGAHYPGLQNNHAANKNQTSAPSAQVYSPLHVQTVSHSPIVQSPISPIQNQSPVGFRPATPVKSWAPVHSPLGTPTKSPQSQPSFYNQPQQQQYQPPQQQQYQPPQPHYQPPQQQYQPPQPHYQPPQQQYQPPQPHYQPSQQYQPPQQQYQPPPQQQYQQPPQQYQPPPQQQYQPPQQQQYQPPPQQQYQPPQQQYQPPQQQYQSPQQQYQPPPQQYQPPPQPQYQAPAPAPTPQPIAAQQPVQQSPAGGVRGKQVEPPPSTIQLRPQAPVSQAPAPVISSQPATATLRGGKHLRGDLKWPPEDVKTKMEEERLKEEEIYSGSTYKPSGKHLRGDLKWPPEDVKHRMEEEKRHQEEIARGPACKPAKNIKDYSDFYAQHQLNDTYPRYVIPPGTQFFRPL